MKSSTHLRDLFAVDILHNSRCYQINKDADIQVQSGLKEKEMIQQIIDMKRKIHKFGKPNGGTDLAKIQEALGIILLFKENFSKPFLGRIGCFGVQRAESGHPSEDCHCERNLKLHGSRMDLRYLLKAITSLLGEQVFLSDVVNSIPLDPVSGRGRHLRA